MTAHSTDDAHVIATAINGGWILRGFKLGIGFWLAGVFIAAVTFAAFIAFGGTVLGLSHLSRGSDVSQAAPADPRDWREQLRANDQAAVEMKRQAEARKLH